MCSLRPKLSTPGLTLRSNIAINMIYFFFFIYFIRVWREVASKVPLSLSLYKLSYLLICCVFSSSEELWPLRPRFFCRIVQQSSLFDGTVKVDLCCVASLTALESSWALEEWPSVPHMATSVPRLDITLTYLEGRGI